MIFSKQDAEDRQQDHELRELEKAQNLPLSPPTHSRDYLYGARASSEAIPAFSQLAPDWDLLEKLAEWGLQQSAKVKLALLEYLEDPTETQLSEFLEIAGLVDNSPLSKKPLSLSKLIQQVLPATQDELYSLARTHHRSKRPEAAVRQTLRTLIKKSVIYEQAGRFYLCQS